MSVAQGLIQYLGSGKLLKLDDPLFSFLGKSSFFKIPTPAIIMIFVLAAGGLILKNTRLGNYAYAIGCNEQHAKSAGIHIDRTLIIIYAMEGLCAGIASILLGCKVSLVSLNAGGLLHPDGYDCGGGSGRSKYCRRTGGNMVGTFLGVIFMGFITNTLTLLNVSAVAQDLFKGIVIVLAIVLNSATSRIRFRRKSVNAYAAE